MKHVILFALSLTALAFAGVVVWANRHALTVPILGFAGGCIALAFALAVPADFKQAVTTIAPYIPVVRGGGSPPSSPS